MEERRLQELAGEILQKQSEDEEMEGEVVQDLIGDVHMKLSVPLVSRENRGPAESVQLHRFSAKG